DVPARLQADAGVDAADGAHRGGVVGVGAAVDDGVPVALLGGAGGADVALVAEEAARLRLGPDPVVEGAQRQGQLTPEQGADRAIAGGGSAQAHEVHVMIDAFGRHETNSLEPRRRGARRYKTLPSLRVLSGLSGKCVDSLTPARRSSYKDILMP